MACLEMYNNTNHPSQPPPSIMSPRISFSNDFVESSSSHNSHHLLRTSRVAPPSSDFEFSVSSNNMLSADELFSHGRLLPFKNNNGNGNGLMQRTLRDELLVDDEVDFSVKPPKGSSSSSSTSNRWKGFLGLRKSHIGSKKSEKSGFLSESPNLTKISEDCEGSSGTEMEMRI